MDRNTLLDLIPAYALGALTPEEAAEVEALLVSDAEAQKLLAEYQDLTDSLVLATPARPAPAHLKADLRQRLAASRAPDSPVSPDARPDAPVEIKVIPNRRARIWIPVAAAAAVLIVLFGALLLRPQQPPDPAQLYAQIAADPNALHYPITPVLLNMTSGELVASADGTQAVVRVQNLPEITADQTYELWLVDSNGVHSAGLMTFADPRQANYISLPLDKSVKDYKGIGVSIEPSGGSPKADGPSGPQAFGVTISS